MAGKKQKMSQTDLQDLVIESDAGARAPTSKVVYYLLVGTAFLWSLFQLWIVSPLPYQFNLFIFNDTETRSIHLGFAVLLSFLAYPAGKHARRWDKNWLDWTYTIAGVGLLAIFGYAAFGAGEEYAAYNNFLVSGILITALALFSYPIAMGGARRRIPAMDWVFAIAGCFCAIYIFIYYEALSERPGNPLTQDIIVACVGMLLLLEATRRALGPPLLVIAVIFLIYTFFGDQDFVPDLIRWKGATLNKIANHQWLTTEGVFGIALGVSTSFVFMFVLFGALLDRAGAGNYFIKVAFSLLGHFRGGPAKAAVLSSGMTGLISGSSIANTVTTGTFTIPLMKRVGFSGTKSGAVEVASSVNGQIMPPVMGAAAFLMVEYVDISYVEVIKHAFLPAVISYIALLYMVHLEALKNNIEGIPKNINKTMQQRVIGAGITIASIIIFSFIVYVSLAEESCFFVINEPTETILPEYAFCINGLKYYAGENMIYIVSILLLVSYILLLKYACNVPELEIDDPNSPVLTLPETGPTVRAGLHYLLPIVVLVWCLMIERLSPGLSAFWATVFMIFILATQKMFKAMFRRESNIAGQLKAGFADLFDGMVMGARNMIGIGVATAAAGIIVGTVSLTGIGQVLTEVVEVLSGGSLIMILLLTALICLILGMGLPTTANYIVVASLMAHVVKELGAQNGLFVPLIAVHMFVFYFGIMADVTPPVGLASFAAAAISGADPIRTGVQAFTYSLRTAILPFFFIFNTELIMIGVDNIWYGLWVFLYAMVAILAFSAAVQGFFFVRNKFYESIMLLLVAVTMFVPQMWVNTFFPAYTKAEVGDMKKILEEMPAGSKVKLYAKGENSYGEPTEGKSFLKIGDGSADDMLNDFGLIPLSEGEEGTVYEVDFNTPAAKTGIEFDFVITGMEIPQEQPNPKWLYIPAILLLGFVIMLQLSRRRRQT